MPRELKDWKSSWQLGGNLGGGGAAAEEPDLCQRQRNRLTPTDEHHPEEREPLPSQQCQAAQAKVPKSGNHLTIKDVHVKSILKSLERISSVMLVMTMMMLVIIKHKECPGFI